MVDRCGIGARKVNLLGYSGISDQDSSNQRLLIIRDRWHLAPVLSTIGTAVDAQAEFAINYLWLCGRGGQACIRMLGVGQGEGLPIIVRNIDSGIPLSIN